jgi:hypothetical protein
MNGASSLTSRAGGVVGNATRRVIVRVTHRPTVGTVGVEVRLASAILQQPLSVLMIQGTTTTATPAEQSSAAAWDRGCGSWVRQRRRRGHRCRRERRGRRQQAENNRQAEGKNLLVADVDVELHFRSSSSCEDDWLAGKELFSSLYQTKQL